MNKMIMLLLSALLLLTSCSSAGSADTASSAMSYKERAEAAGKLDSRLARQSNELGLRLFSQLRAQDGGGGNLTISPYSISAALALAYNGSKGDTAAELGKLLGYAPGELKKLNAAQAALLPLLNDVGSGIELEMASSVWTDQGLPLRKDYLNRSKTYYDAEIKTTDLNAEKSVTKINQWASDHTAGKIDRMIEQPPGPQAVAVLLNALYFKGEWTEKFPLELSKPADFHVDKDISVQVLLMKQSGLFAYAENEEWQAIRLPYGEGQMDMMVILPAEQSSLEQVLDQLSQMGLPAEEQFTERGGAISLPRFTASYGTELKEAVQALGVQLAFDPNKGNFSALADTGTSIFISSIIHKTYINVNESGTEAAASTAVKMLAGGAASAEVPFEMTVNRPFLFIIEDRQTGVWLFMGAIENPLTE